MVPPRGPLGRLSLFLTHAGPSWRGHLSWRGRLALASRGRLARVFFFCCFFSCFFFFFFFFALLRPLPQRLGRPAFHRRPRRRLRPLPRPALSPPGPSRPAVLVRTNGQVPLPLRRFDRCGRLRPRGRGGRPVRRRLARSVRPRAPRADEAGGRRVAVRAGCRAPREAPAAGGTGGRGTTPSSRRSRTSDSSSSRKAGDERRPSSPPSWPTARGSDRRAPSSIRRTWSSSRGSSGARARLLCLRERPRLQAGERGRLLSLRERPRFKVGERAPSTAGRWAWSRITSSRASAAGA